VKTGHSYKLCLFFEGKCGCFSLAVGQAKVGLQFGDELFILHDLHLKAEEEVPTLTPLLADEGTKYFLRVEVYGVR